MADASTVIPVRGTYRDITDDLILDAAQRHGRPLGQRNYIDHDSDDCPVCAVGALAVDIEPRLIDEDFYDGPDSFPTWKYVVIAYQLSDHDERALSRGFEGDPLREGASESERHLFFVGASVARRAGLTNGGGGDIDIAGGGDDTSKVGEQMEDDHA